MPDDLLADFLAKRLGAHRKRAAEALLERFKQAKGRAPASVAELQTFLIEERMKGKQS
jgi:hypothetical protein